MNYETIRVDVSDGLGVLTLNRPHVRNALSLEMIQELRHATAALERDKAVRAVLLRAAGEHFMVGGDVKRLHRAVTTERQDYTEGFEHRAIEAHQVVAALFRMPKPVLVAVQGAAAGFGMALVMSADLAIAARDAYFGYAYSKIGLSSDGGATYFLPRLVGERRALELALLGDRFDAQRAYELGIVNRLVEPASLEEEAMTLAKRLAAGPTLALAEVKRLVRSSMGRSWDEQSNREAESVAAMSATQDHLEGVTAFVEKRAPVFTGR
ncbi:enoyl-CoA hydratase/isomerase family protein [Ramlibacter sp.]|uniref:enoyl-CoA hydratase/isomerase family protein n=1 Tax=Ramlibacter sp. TaxID=1917967 RepID=UPI003D1020F6